MSSEPLKRTEGEEEGKREKKGRRESREGGGGEKMCQNNVGLTLQTIRSKQNSSYPATLPSKT